MYTFLDWIDVSRLSFNSLLLLEKVQLSWLLEGGVPDDEMALALAANPTVEWYLRHKCSELNGWLDQLAEKRKGQPIPDAETCRNAEEMIMRRINDWLVYIIDPGIYDTLPFLGWDSRELASLVDFTGKTVLDIGSGTGRLAFVAAEKAATVFAIEPVGCLREYIKTKARTLGLQNVFAIDGLITDIPLPAAFADVTMGGHVFGDHPDDEYAGMLRVTKPGGTIILCPGNNDNDDDRHEFLVSKGFQWLRFEEPGDGMKRKYWKTIEE